MVAARPVPVALALGVMEQFDRSFRFVDARLQGDLLALVRASAAPHAVEADGTLRYAAADEELVENELICSVRNQVFPDWKVFTLEGDETPRPRTTARYRAHMAEHGIPFVEELADEFAWFLIPDEHDSFAWDVQDERDWELPAPPDRGGSNAGLR